MQRTYNPEFREGIKPAAQFCWSLSSDEMLNRMDTHLKDKRALVCGASKGIGRACANELSRLGAAVTLIARDEEALAPAIKELPVDENQAHAYLVADFADPPTVRKVVAQYLEASGLVHILINNSGGPPAGALIDSDSDALAAAFNRHLVCSQYITQLCVPGMKGVGFGRIINIISTSVIAPIKGLGVSNTIRGAMANWGRTLAGELAPFGITVNNVLPGYTDTDRLRLLLEGKAAQLGVSFDEIQKQVLGTIPMARLGKPEELAAVVGFLASPSASYVSGVNLPVDGGRTATQ